MVEWIEMNRMLGVSHFYMYNDSMSEELGCILSHYQQQGLITLLPWDIPISIGDRKVVRIRGQFLAFNDCIYRAMTRARWLMIIDTDELVIPRQERQLTTLLDSLVKNYSRADGNAGFIFKNFFFFLEWEDDPVSSVPLLTSRKTRRVIMGTPIPQRSKYIVRPLEIIEPGNHFVWKHVNDAYNSNVPEEHAIMHHYRINRIGKVPINETVVDRIAHRWTKNLWKRVKTKLQNIQCLQIKHLE
ncbi:uncharacterized protein LOC126369103 [Pectinophora gossypiella]|uniref:uncharacterized protein LOC126369103 n=1 Tax=Pectinophora gossypiella TaxID=13191 RepID=UPI00214EB776|nr:uncharacterized protein LOC126369103 [Pectinophora gossypiella]